MNTKEGTIISIEQLIKLCSNNNSSNQVRHLSFFSNFLPASFTPTSNGFVEGKSLLVVFGFYFFPTPPSGPPWNEGHRPRVHHETSVLEVLAPGTTRTLLLFKFYWCIYFILYLHGTQVSHITGRSRPPGKVGLTPRQYTEWNVMGARTLYWRSLSVGAAAWCVLYCQYRKVCSPTLPNARQANELSTTTDPRSCARVVYIAGDTLRHQPMGAGHMTVL